MAFRAKAFKGLLSVKDPLTGNMVTQIGDGMPEPITIDGDTFKGRYRVYQGKHDSALGFGVPTEAQMKHPQLMIETIDPAHPWPGSHCDGEGKKEGQWRMRNKANLPKDDPGHWPQQRERDAQARLTFKGKYPVEYTKRMLTAHGIAHESQDGQKRLADAMVVEAGGDPGEWRRSHVEIDLTPPDESKAQKKRQPAL